MGEKLFLLWLVFMLVALVVRIKCREKSNKKMKSEKPTETKGCRCKTASCNEALSY